MTDIRTSHDVRVLILYQYDHEAEDRQPRIIEETRRLLSEQKVGGWSVQATTLREAMPRAAGQSFWQHFLEMGVKAFDYAIAFFTYDPRPASSAGNLWLEVGYWLARHGGSTLLLVKEIYDDSEKDGRVKPPSNLGGLPYVAARHAGDVFTELSDLIDKSFVPGRAEVDRFSSEFRETLRSTPWTHEEEEVVSLKKPDSRRSPGKGLCIGSRLYRCDLRITRRSTLPRPEFKIGVAVEPWRLPEDRYAYTWLIGPGVLAQAGDEELVSALRTMPIDENGLGQVLRIKSARLLVAEQSIDYKLRDFRRDTGWAILDFHASLPTESYHQDSVLELKLVTWVSRSVGWYHYFAPRSIGRKLCVALDTPFRVVAVPTILPGSAKPDVTTGRTRGRYHCRVEVNGPVFAGSQIFWVFADQPKEEVEMAAKRRSAKKKATKKKATKKKKKKKKKAAKRRNGGSGSGGK